MDFRFVLFHTYSRVNIQISRANMKMQNKQQQKITWLEFVDN